VVVLPDAPGRFVRLVWSDPAGAPALHGASVLVAANHEVSVDSARELTFAASPEPPATGASDPAARRALHFDLGGILPLIDVDLRFDSGTHVAPVRLQGRTRADQPWRDLGSGVFYRLERGGDVGSSPAIALPVAVRFLRVVPDERAAALDAAQARLVVHAALASLVFATQGESPFRLLAGSRDACRCRSARSCRSSRASALRPRHARHPAVDAAAERHRMRRAAGEVASGLLIAGAAGLGALVWRLARSGPAQPPASPAPPA
jgi:hypothetical protein